MKNVSLLLLILISINSVAQTEKNTWAVSGELCLPSGVTNKAYKNYLNGLVNAQAKIQYKPFKSVFFSLAPRYTLHTISEFKTPIKLNGAMHQFGLGAEMGYQYWFKNNMAIELSAQVGYTLHYVKADSLQKLSNGTYSRFEYHRQNYGSMYYQPTFSFLIRSDEAVVYKWILGYNIDTYVFKPADLGLKTMGGLNPDDIKRNSQGIFFGFGLSYYFGNPRDDQEFKENPE